MKSIIKIVHFYIDIYTCYKSKKEVDEKFNSLKKELARISENGKKLTQEKKEYKRTFKVYSYIHANKTICRSI